MDVSLYMPHQKKKTRGGRGFSFRSDFQQCWCFSGTRTLSLTMMQALPVLEIFSASDSKRLAKQGYKPSQALLWLLCVPPEWIWIWNWPLHRSFKVVSLSRIPLWGSERDVVAVESCRSLATCGIIKAWWSLACLGPGPLFSGLA